MNAGLRVEDFVNGVFDDGACAAGGEVDGGNCCVLGRVGNHDFD